MLDTQAGFVSGRILQFPLTICKETIISPEHLWKVRIYQGGRQYPKIQQLGAEAPVVFPGWLR